jgi:hypothetical protein
LLSRRLRGHPLEEPGVGTILGWDLEGDEETAVC